MTVIESIDKQIKKESFKKGLILGAIVLSLSIFSFYFIISMVNYPKVILISTYIFSYILPLAISVLFTMMIRKNIGGYWTFRQAVTGIFIMFICSYVVLTIGRDLLFIKLIEPGMVDKTEATMVQSSTIMYKELGYTPVQIKNNLLELKKGIEDQKNMSVYNDITGYILTCILLFVVALGLAAIVKKDSPAAILVKVE